MTTRDTIRERMLQDYAPDPNAQVAFRTPAALEYIAFFLGEINTNLGEIVELMRKQEEDGNLSARHRRIEKSS